ncbi:MAG: glycogen debranching protein [Merismopedia sp. SIO2A8]|nr:glycogen debranching protein [Symploca sp. SIO2B6]NET49060.1 glycogen debranching protein [Merismopedia sp. SIO2A8]
MTIWVNEQIDPCGIIQACIACQNEAHARACHEEFLAKLTHEQVQQGWIAQLRTVDSWDEVPVAALKLSV